MDLEGDRESGPPGKSQVVICILENTGMDPFEMQKVQLLPNGGPTER